LNHGARVLARSTPSGNLFGLSSALGLLCWILSLLWSFSYPDGFSTTNVECLLQDFRKSLKTLPFPGNHEIGPHGHSLTTMLATPTKSEADWGRPRRQTDPNVVRRPSELLRQAARRSAECSPRTPEQRPRTSGSATSNTNTTASTITTPKRNSTPSHRSSLSVHALSNPALAEIPSRKYNALRLSTGSSDGHSLVGANVQCAPASTPRDMADIIVPPPDAASNAPPTCTTTPPHTTTPHLISFNSYSSQSSSEARSSSFKKAPASRSSLGIETNTGPPPAISTQHTSFQDRLLRPHSQRSTPTSPKSTERYDSPSIDAILKTDSPGGPVSPVRRRQSNPLSPRSTTTNDRMTSTRTDGGGPSNRVYHRERTNPPQPIGDEANADEIKDSSTDGSRSKSEDIFLNIAQSSGGGRPDSFTKSDRRRVSSPKTMQAAASTDGDYQRLGLSGLSTRSSLAKEQTPSPEQLKYQRGSFLSDDGSPLVAHPSPASAHPLDESSRTRYYGAGSGARSTIGVPRSRFSRETSPESPQTYADLRSTITDARFRSSNLSNLSGSRTIRQASTSDAAERARAETEKARLDGTESTLSTTAPSTVWDELDDLKSRIRKLELTGKFPSSSAAAMSNVSTDRPRTAATTATTLSSSPKRNRKSSVSPESESSTTANPIQTLLHSALSKAKVAVNHKVFNALEATTTDALTLTNILSSTSTSSATASTVNGGNMPDRQAKRKADSLCRSLTELCLALSEDQTISLPKQQPPPQDQPRPASRDTPSRLDNSDTVSTVTSRFRRSMSHEPEVSDQPDSGSRVSSRFESRRASTINLGSGRRETRLSHDEKASPQTPSLTAPMSRLNHLSGSFRGKREDDSDDKSSAFSRTGPSRAMTEIAGYSSGRRPTTRDRLSREYGTPNSSESPSIRLSTAQQPSQSPQMYTPPSVQSSIPQRRSYASPAGSGIPAASGVNVQPGFRRYGPSSGLSHSVSDRAVSQSPGETVASSLTLPQTRIVAPSSKIATSYTSIQQPRLRTESSGTRRLGLRSRPSAIGQDTNQ
jgi:hypothetical protein